jgi:hypothetical protein
MRMKRCPDCGETRSLEEFPRNRSAKDGRQGYCKPCWNVRIARHAEKLYGSRRNYLLQLRYGITEAEADAMLEGQGGLCAICRTKPAKHVDHCHATGVVRGVLCFGCNRGLGKAGDDPELLRRGLSYLLQRGWHGQLQLW